MSAPTWLSAAEYAAHRGCSDSFVRRMRRTGRLVVDEAGRIDRDASDALLAREADPVRGGDRTRGDEPAAMPVEPAPSNAGAAPAATGLVVITSDQISLREAMRRERLAKARTAELELGEATRELTRTREVERVVFTLARQALERLRGISSRLRARLAAETDPRAIEALIDAEIREVCDEMQAAADQLRAPAALAERSAA